MDYEQAKKKLDEYAMSGALGNVRAVLEFLLAEVQRLVELVDELRGEDDE